MEENQSIVERKQWGDFERMKWRETMNFYMALNHCYYFLKNVFF